MVTVPGTNWGSGEGNWFGEDGIHFRGGSVCVYECGEGSGLEAEFGVRTEVMRRSRTELCVAGPTAEAQGGPRRAAAFGGRVGPFSSPHGPGASGLQPGLPGGVTLEVPRSGPQFPFRRNRGQTHPPRRQDAKLGRGAKRVRVPASSCGRPCRKALGASRPAPATEPGDTHLPRPRSSA